MSKFSTRFAGLFGIVLFLFCAGLVSASGPVEPAFTYQGRLTDGGSPANGVYDFQFKLFDGVLSSTQIGSTLIRDNVNVAGGLFTVTLDFGINAFNGDERFIEIGVRAGSSTGAYMLLSPRQALNPAPYALALPAFHIVQNAGVPNLVGGYSGNSLAANVDGSVIVGGGSSTAPNHIEGDRSFIGGGSGNEDVGNGDSVIGGGAGNLISGHEGTIGGGGGNTIGGDHNTIGGGINNVVGGDEAVVSGGNGNHANGNTSTVAGGTLNFATGPFSFIGGGRSNTSTMTYTVVSGGFGNTSSASFATVGGGENNQATGADSTVPGGSSNVASGKSSFAAGLGARALHDNTFVWSGLLGGTFDSTGEGQFLIRAGHGVGINTNAPLDALHVIRDINSTSAPDTNVALIENTSLVNGGDVLALRSDFTGNPNSGTNFITFFKGGTDTSLGAIEGNGSGGVSLDGPGNDYAEWLPRADAHETIQPGDLVAVKDGQVTKDTRGATQFMVVSTSPIVGGNDPGESNRNAYALLSFIGQVDARVRGVVHAGDFIIPSGMNDGVGVAVSPDKITTEQFAQVVGQAWSASENENVKSVRVAVGLARLDPNVARLAAQNQKQAAQITQLESRLSALEESVPANSATANALPLNLLSIGGLVVFGIVLGGLWQRRRQ